MFQTENIIIDKAEFCMVSAENSLRPGKQRKIFGLERAAKSLMMTFTSCYTYLYFRVSRLNKKPSISSQLFRTVLFYLEVFESESTTWPNYKCPFIQIRVQNITYNGENILNRSNFQMHHYPQGQTQKQEPNS
jgi:hypothetical protein